MMAWRGCIEAHHPMAITPLEVAAPLPLDHERTASITAQQFSGNRVVAGSAMRHQLMSRNSQRSPGNAYSVCRGLLP